ncbi:hypothetical protein BCR44DRAFT_1431584 [Catenaria anguillulae PL171]|uniref:Uncharacterized protein n=1 Tax=Catenaria anguillulae PL171 TaxID=765915 RepID=A0A1Y2HRD2_9FUNG|nr:hypothetical protein BCR44DRAFT_1431584 [Catenaria anguillulae PL171]
MAEIFKTFHDHFWHTNEFLHIQYYVTLGSLNPPPDPPTPALADKSVVAAMAVAPSLGPVAIGGHAVAASAAHGSLPPIPHHSLAPSLLLEAPRLHARPHS